MYYKLATVATDWWIEQMKKKCKKLYPDKLIFDRSGLIIIDNSLLKELSAFSDILIDEISKTLKTYFYISLSCSYHPDKKLMELIKKSGISTAYFPTHAEMEIVNNSIFVSTNHDDPYKLPIDL